MRSRALAPALVVIATLATLFAALHLIAFAFGEPAAGTLRRAFEGTWGTAYGVGQVLFKATPLLFTGFAFHVAARAGLFNIGAEGQLALGSLIGAIVAARLPAWTPAILAIPIVLAVAGATGAIVALPPAVMRARLGVHEVITGIMMNRIVDVILPWSLVAVLGAKALRTDDVVPGAALLKLDRAWPALSGSAVSVAFFLAVAVAIAASVWLGRSRPGREMRWIGLNSAACRAEGVDVRRRMILAMLLSGSIAAWGMSATVLGYKGYYELGLGAGTGFAGIAVALLGRGHPAGLVLAAVYFGTLEQAGLAVNARVPKEAMGVLEAIAMVVVAASGRLAEKAGREADRAPPPAPEPRAEASKEEAA